TKKTEEVMDTTKIVTEEAEENAVPMDTVRTVEEAEENAEPMDTTASELNTTTSELIEVSISPASILPENSFKKSKSKISDNKINSYIFVKNLICAGLSENLESYEFSTTAEVPEKKALNSPHETVWRYILIRT